MTMIDSSIYETDAQKERIDSFFSFILKNLQRILIQFYKYFRTIQGKNIITQYNRLFKSSKDRLSCIYANSDKIV